MTFETDHRLRAITLMRQALELLDRADEHGAAAHLQHAISVADREPPPAIDDDAAFDGWAFYGGDAEAGFSVARD